MLSPPLFTLHTHASLIPGSISSSFTCFGMILFNDLPVGPLSKLLMLDSQLSHLTLRYYKMYTFFF